MNEELRKSLQMLINGKWGNDYTCRTNYRLGEPAIVVIDFYHAGYKPISTMFKVKDMCNRFDMQIMDFQLYTLDYNRFDFKSRLRTDWEADELIHNVLIYTAIDMFSQENHE